MKLFNLKHPSQFVTPKQAVLQGLGKDEGLFMFESIPKLPAELIQHIEDYSFYELCFQVASRFFTDVPNDVLHNIIEDAYDFDIPLIKLSDNLYTLELFHGPTCAFKDVGARFMARLMQYYLRDSDKPLRVFAATSGDTGAAIANAFYKLKNTEVYVLYPSGMVSPLQEQTLTTLGGNVTAFEVDGSFDDCHALVRQIFLDQDLQKQYVLASGNSLNIARLVPQVFYYVWLYAQLSDKQRKTVISVPTGNVGNLTAGMIAKQMGIPLYRFIAASNANNAITRYIHTGTLHPKPTIKTVSNAMDVGNPSNFPRLLHLCNNSYENFLLQVAGSSWSDQHTHEGIKEVHQVYQYIIDPHGAVGYRALQQYLQNEDEDVQSVVLETAHPAKFKSVVQKAMSVDIDLPSQLQQYVKKKKQSTFVSANYSTVKALLTS